MNVIAHMERAFERGESVFSASDLLRWICEGHGGLAIGERMSGSWLRLADGTAEVGHLAGDWNDADARFITDAMKEDLAEHGIAKWHYAGRPGWNRFLRIRRFEP